MFVVNQIADNDIEIDFSISGSENITKIDFLKVMLHSMETPLSLLLHQEKIPTWETLIRLFLISATNTNDNIRFSGQHAHR